MEHTCWKGPTHAAQLRVCSLECPSGGLRAGKPTSKAGPSQLADVPAYPHRPPRSFNKELHCSTVKELHCSCEEVFTVAVNELHTAVQTRLCYCCFFRLRAVVSFSAIVLKGASRPDVWVVYLQFPNFLESHIDELLGDKVLMFKHLLVNCPFKAEAKAPLKRTKH